MNEQPTHLNGAAEIREGDILFDCPHCGKSMAIEAAGAGLMVPCADCGRQVQVPIPDASTPAAPVAASRPFNGAEDPQVLIEQLDAALAMANQQNDRLIAEKEALQERRAFLEHLRVTNATRLEQAARELESIQDALDRTMALLAEIRTEKPV